MRLKSEGFGSATLDLGAFGNDQGLTQHYYFNRGIFSPLKNTHFFHAELYVDLASVSCLLTSRTIVQVLGIELIPGTLHFPAILVLFI